MPLKRRYSTYGACARRRKKITPNRKQVGVARHHVLGAHVDERQQHDAGAFLDESLVAFGDGMRLSMRAAKEVKKASILR